MRTSRGLDLGSSGGSLGSLLYPVWLRTRQARSRCDVPDGSCSYEPSGAIFVPGGGAEQTRKFRQQSAQAGTLRRAGGADRGALSGRDVAHTLAAAWCPACPSRPGSPAVEGRAPPAPAPRREARASRPVVARSAAPLVVSCAARDRQRRGAAGRPPIQTHPRRCVRPWEEAEEGGGGRGGCGTWLGAFSAQGLCSVFSRASGPEKSAGEPSGEALRGVRNSGTNPRGEGTRPVRPRGVSVGLPSSGRESGWVSCRAAGWRRWGRALTAPRSTSRPAPASAAGRPRRARAARSAAVLRCAPAAAADSRPS